MSRPLGRDARHIALARALHKRLYVNCEGRVFAIGGRVAHEKLHQTFLRYGSRPTAAEAPTPAELGAPACDGELSPHLLHSIRFALHRWRAELSAERRRKPAKRRTAAALAREQEEIERLGSRLDCLQQWREAIGQGREPEGAPYFLDSAAEEALLNALAGARQEHPLTPLIAWQARLVFWLSGACAARRFLSATAQVLVAYPKTSRYARIDSFQQAVIVWKQRHRDRRERIQNLLKEIALHIQRLPLAVVRKGKFSARLRGRTFQEHCDLLLERCAQLTAEMQRQRWHAVPAALAALAAADGSPTALPQRYFRSAAERENFSQLLGIIENLGKQIGRPGYDRLLGAIDRLPGMPCEFEYDLLRQLLARGESLDDCLWACNQGLLHNLAASSLGVRAVRRLGEAFAERGCPLSRGDLALLAHRIQGKEGLQSVYAWLAWLGSVSPRAMTPRLQQILHAAFRDRYLPIVERPGWFAQLAPCLATVRRTKDPRNLQPLLDRIAALQRFVGRKESTPKSLRKLLDAGQRRQREREALRTRQEAGVLDRAAQARWEHLENNSDNSPDAAKIRRAAEEAFLLLGIESLNVATRSLAEAECRTRLGEMVAAFEPDQFLTFALWMDAMSESQRRCLDSMLAAHACYGREYKRYLAENRGWIGRALLRGVDLDPWFAAESHAVELGGRRMEIELAGDLLHLFLMGAYFRTCLSPGGCNEMSVLANAYDANKQVVFMFARDGVGRRHVVARQLIAVSSDFKLLGYRCYVSSRCAGKANRDKAVAAMASYCGRLAAQCQLELADQGSPQEIGDHFWYDDGECEWPQAARTAWVEASQTAEAKVLAACGSPTASLTRGFELSASFAGRIV